MAKGKVTPPEMVEKIKVCVASGMSYLETARVNGIADSTVHMVMKRVLSNEEQKARFEKLKEQKQNEMQAQANKDFDKMMKERFENLMEKSVNVINKAIDEEKMTPSDAIRTVGILFDKRQVMTGGKTANVGISFEEVMQKINEGNEF